MFVKMDNSDFKKVPLDAFTFLQILNEQDFEL